MIKTHTVHASTESDLRVSLHLSVFFISQIYTYFNHMKRSKHENKLNIIAGKIV